MEPKTETAVVRAETEALRVEELPMWRMLLFSLGQFGWSLSAFAVGSLLNYYYFPPIVDGAPAFPVRIFQGAVVGVLTILGLSSFAGRLFDAITDPWIAVLSDRSKRPFGRRRFFMLIGAFPAALFSVLVFTPPVHGVSPLNAVWLLVTLLAFYLFMTIYTIPYGALIPELGCDSKKRLILATLTSITWAVGFFVGNSAYALKDLFQSAGLSPDHAFVLVVALFAAIGFLAMMLPVLFIDERRFCRKTHSEEGAFQALFGALRNREFRIVLLGQFAYYAANAFLEIGIVYYVTILMRLPESDAFTLMAVMFVASFALYPLVLAGARRFGKKNMMVMAFAVQSLVFAMMAVTGKVPFLSAKTWGWTIILVQTIPAAVTGILATAIIADIARADGVRTGNHKEAVFYASNTFAMKMATSLSNLVFPSLLLLGRSVDNDVGVRMTCAVALALCIAACWGFTKYREEIVEADLATERIEIVNADIGKKQRRGVRR
ncbi:MAG: MFS transporter [Spirochaetaceae bacterium]|nr:MFS transporter [Spirochaetaceae bacterium]